MTPEVSVATHQRAGVNATTAGGDVMAGATATGGDVMAGGASPAPTVGAGLAPPARNSTVTLSVVVVSYNRRDLLARCLDAVLADPDAPDFELFVVDNASHDGSAEMVRQQYPGVRLIANRENVGFGKANNQAFAQATGRYLLMLNPDTVARPGALRALVEYAEAHPAVGAVGGRLEYEDGTFQHSAFRFPDWKQAFFGFFDGFVPLDSAVNGRYAPAQYEQPFPAEHLLGACLPPF